jgi:hypothetical protein
LVLVGDLAKMVDEGGGRKGALQPEHSGPKKVNDELEKPINVFLKTVTTVILLVFYCAACTSLTFAFGLVLFHELAPKQKENKSL